MLVYYITFGGGDLNEKILLMLVRIQLFLITKLL